MRKSFFTLRMTEPWNRLPIGDMVSPSLEIVKAHLYVACKTSSRRICFSRELG